MNSLHARQRRLYAFKLVVRRLPLIALAAAGTAALVWSLLTGPSSTVTATQGMALQNVRWTDVAAAHGRNEAWFNAARDGFIGDDPVDVRIVLPEDRQLTAFTIVATGVDGGEAVAAADRAAVSLMESQGGYVPITGEIRDTLEAELDDLNALNAGHQSSIEEMRSEYDRLVEADAARATRENLADQTKVLEIEWEQNTRRAADVTNRLSALDVDDVSLESLIERFGEPTIVEAVEPDTRLRGAVLAAFVVASLLAWAMIRFDRRSALTSIGQVRYHFPDLPMLDLASDVSNLSSPALVALLTHTGGDAESKHSLVIPAGEPSGSRRLIESVRSIPAIGIPTFTTVAEPLDSQAALPDVDRVLIAVTAGKTTGRELDAARRRWADVPSTRLSGLFIDDSMSVVDAKDEVEDDRQLVLDLSGSEGSAPTKGRADEKTRPPVRPTSGSKNA